MPQNKISVKVGIYGDTGAGKTRFLYRLLSGFRENSDVHFSEVARIFLENLDKQIEQGDIAHTFSRTDDLEVRFPNRLGSDLVVNTCSEETIFELKFCDLRGEELRKDLDALSLPEREDNFIGNQIVNCDAFLFFFDPVGVDQEEENRMIRLKRERDRADQFIQKVIDTRGNKNLPVLFVQTHADQMDPLPEIERSRIDQWLESVHRIVVQKYEPLEKQYPKSLLESNKTCFQISSVRSFSELIPLIGSLLDLVCDYRKFERSDKKKVFRFLILLVLLFFFIAGGAYQLYTRDLERYVAVSPKIPTEEEVLIRNLNDLPAGWPDRPSLRKTMKRAFDRIERLKENKDPDPGDPLDLVAAFEKAGKRIERKILDEDLPVERRLKIAELLAGLYSVEVQKIADSFDMGKIARKTEDLLKKRLTKEMREAVDRNTKMGSVPEDLLRDLLSLLNETEDRIGKMEIFFADSKHGLIGEIKDASTFLRARIKQRNYSVRILIEGSAPQKTTLAVNFKNQKEDNAVSLSNQKTEKADPDGSFRFVLSSNPNTFTLPLDRDISRLEVSQWDREMKTWRDLYHSGSLRSERSLSLAALGMGLVFKEESVFRIQFSDENKNSIRLQICFQPVYDPLPPILWNILSEKGDQ